MMKITKQQEEEVLKVYNIWWHSYLNGDIQTYDSYLDDEFHFVGSTNGEEYLNRKDTTDFFRATADQLAGKAELRNAVRSIEGLENGLVLITEVADAYITGEPEWAFYSRFRFSSLLRKNKEGWRFIYQHFSAPDSKAQEGETLGLEQISKENEVLRDAIKRRTVELELKNRELEIEAALERVRSRTMAMQKSEELADVATALFQQVKALGVPQWACGFNIWEIGDTVCTFYPGSPEGDILPPCKVPLTEDTVFKLFDESRRRGDELCIYESKDDIQKEHYRYMANLPGGLGDLLQNMVKAGMEFPIFQIDHLANFSHGNLLFITYEHFPIMHDIFKRFARVFEQTYTRFLDLQKAEAQTKEAEIQLALERVRARTMAMQRSDELKEVVAEVFEKLLELGFGLKNGAAIILIFNKDSKDHIEWVADPSQVFPRGLKMPFFENPLRSDVFKAWQSGIKYYSKEYSRELKDDFFAFTFEHTDYKFIANSIKEVIRKTEKYSYTIAFGENTAIGIPDTTGRLFTAQEEEILTRFAKVFEQTYTRFLDLQKAETQARDAGIELALERVRARTMAMQRSEELSGVASILFDQLRILGGELWTCGFVICDQDKMSAQQWLSISRIGILPPTVIPPNLTPQLQNLFDAWKNGEEIYVEEVKGDTLRNHYDLMKTLPDIKKMFPPGIKAPSWQMNHAAIFKQGYLLIVTTQPFKDIQLFTRFAKVFEQTYTRFLDLQKVEAQAREAQIETALERVRSRSLAMHKTEELSDVVKSLFEELEQFGFARSGCELILVNEKNEMLQFWNSNPVQNKILESFNIPKSIHPFFEKQWKAWRNQIPRLTITLKGEEKNKFDQLIFTKTDFKHLPEEVKKFIRNHGVDVFSFAIMKHGLLEVVDAVQISESMFSVLERFAKVFEQTYTRFLDLQKAEAQAREAQIEAALERVRAGAMAMHRSDELSDVLSILFEQFDVLNIRPVDVHLDLFDLEKNTFSYRATGKEGTRVIAEQIVDLDSRPEWLSLAERWKNGKPNTVDFSYYPKEVIRDLMAFFPDIWASMPPEAIMIPEEDFPDGIYDTLGYCKFGFLGFHHNRKTTEEENRILIRFTNEFERLYQRFLDLQKAEAQAREAQIEGALERVRSRTISMQKSEELQESALLLFQQVEALGMPPFACGFNIWDENKKEATAWMGSINGLQPPFKTDSSRDVYLPIYEAAQRNESLFIVEQSGKELEVHYKYLATIPVFRDIIMESWKQSGVSIPTFQIIHCAFFTYGYLMFISFEPVKAYYEIFKRFAKVFEQTYTRFLDLQKAEAQAREAIKQASLDRVRGEIASMRSKDDLNRITPLIWKELNALGVPFIRCGVFIMVEERRMIQTYLSTPDGQSLTAFEMPYDSEGVAAGAVFHWNKKEIYQDHWDKKQFLSFMQKLVKAGQIKNTESFQGSSAPPESLDLHFLPFKQGMLYVGNTSPLAREELKMVQSLAESFSIAYARYEDFRQLEEAKNQIESTLTELKATQAQLIQSEKMASLGELTAGIAHEIQNPLNFVNNFSEVNTELIDELKAERSKAKSERDEMLEDELIADLSQNTEKIHHHGQRASDIVKGMLEHSRSGDRKRELIDINALADEFLRLAYHGLRAKDKSFNSDFKTDFDPSLPKINVVPQDIGRVLLNLINNAFYAVDIKAKSTIDGYKPELILTTKKIENFIEIGVQDNGDGIPKNIKDKIFQPFFTTKPTGQGTGLGLSLSYDIIKAHNGELKVVTEEGEGTKFIVLLPIRT